MSIDFAAIVTVAAQEARIHVRNKWTVIFAFVFGALALAISYFGLVTAGAAGFQGFERTTASLLNLVLYLIPIVALTMGTLSLTGERGASELLFSQPVGRGEILLGKVLGLFVSLAAATFFGFGLSGLVIARQAGTAGVARYVAFAGLALWLALVFLSLGALVAVAAKSRARAFGVSLFLWFLFVIFYDLLIMGVAFVVKERTANLMIFLALFGNPVDLVRVASLITLSDPAIFGAAGAALVKFLGGRAAGGAAVAAALALWTIVPLVIAARVLRRQDL